MAKKKTSGKATAQNAQPPKKPDAIPGVLPKQTACLFSVPRELPEEFVASIKRLEKALDKNILLFVHLTGPSGIAHIHDGICRQFVTQKALLRKTKMAVLVDSPGGSAEAAYRISRLLQRQCGEFTAIVPRWAKSAATLMVLGAHEIIMGDDAELGPLDAQYFDYNTAEDWVSALDTVQAVEQLEENASQLAANMLKYLHNTTHKQYNLLLRQALHFAADITRPLFQGVDAVRYTRQARVLKEAQDYAERLLQHKFSVRDAKAIAAALVRNYATHGFVIDRQEANQLDTRIDETTGNKVTLGLGAKKPPNREASTEINWLYNNMDDIIAFGFLEDLSSGTGGQI